MRWVLILILNLTLASGCTTTRTLVFPTARSPIEAFYRDILAMKPELPSLSAPGPFAVKEVNDFAIRVSKDDVLVTDLYMSEHNDKAPLVIIQHGNLGSKAYHHEQARLLASWGAHVLTLEQVNEKHWVENGNNLAKLVILLQRWPALLDSKFNPQKIILAGHSFGGSAIGIAAGSGINVRGLIFLDPALYNNAVPPYLSRIKASSFILAADRHVFNSRFHNVFYNRIGAQVAEISVTGATHNDAQFPNQFSWAQSFGLDQKPAEDKQQVFAAAMVSLVMSYTVSGSWVKAWPLLNDDVGRGRLQAPKFRNKLD